MKNTLVLPTTKKLLQQGNYGTFEIAPVLSSLSRSLASALRRVLLSSLPGAAITSVRIEGVNHEFQDIDNVKEDVPEIVQNLKKVRLRNFSDHPTRLYLNAYGARHVVAGDIAAPGTIDIVNPELHLATLDNEQAYLSMEMMAAPGRRFVAFDKQGGEMPPIGTILIDAIYSPVVHVNFTIEPVPEANARLHTILLEITTDGTTSPDEALRQAAEILRTQFAVFASGRYDRDEPASSPHESSVLIPPHIYTMPLADLGLSVRVHNVLKRYGIQTVGPLLEMSEQDLLGMKNMGEKTLKELCHCFKKRVLLPEMRKESV